MEKGKNKKVIAAGLLVMSLTMACNSALAPILAEVGKFFPDATDSAIQIVLTLINLTTLPMMLLEPLMLSLIHICNIKILIIAKVKSVCISNTLYIAIGKG